MIGDGELEYDIGNDGEKYSLGACSVSTAHISFAKWPTQTRRANQANFRRTNVATKLKMTYLRDQYLNVKMQYKACECSLSRPFPQQSISHPCFFTRKGDEWTECFTVYGIALPTAPYVGFSALTGDVSDNHEYVSTSPWTTYTPYDNSPLCSQHHLRHDILRHPLQPRPAARQADGREVWGRRSLWLGLDDHQDLPLRRLSAWRVLRVQTVYTQARQGRRWVRVWLVRLSREEHAGLRGCAV